MAPTSALPIGAARVVSEMQPLLVDPSLSGSGLYNAVLAVLATPNADETERYDEEILDLPVLGFIVMCVSRSSSTSLSPLSLALLLTVTCGMQHRAGHREQAHDGAVSQSRLACGQNGDRGLVRVAGMSA